MFRSERRALDLPALLSSLTGRPVRIGEIIEALDLGRSTYYEQRDEGRLISADNMLRLARDMGLNPVELLLHCGLIERDAVIDCAERAEAGAIAKRDRRFKRRPDAPPL